MVHSDKCKTKQTFYASQRDAHLFLHKRLMAALKGEEYWEDYKL